MAWIVLVFAGLFEVAWSLGLPSTAGFTKPLPSVATVAAIVASMYLLSVAVRTIPIGTAYAVWVGIGVLGATVFGVVFRAEPLGVARASFVVLLLVAVVGLKLTAPTR